jgi:ABC-2 type transport system permease protein
MLKKLFSYLRLVGAYLRINLHAQLEYRAAFVSQAVAMFLNNCIWLGFWCLFFTRFPVLGDWTIKDYITLWAICAGGFGLGHCVAGNSLMLASAIARGQLDAWMLYPRCLLPHFILGKMSATAFGDLVFGFVVYVVLVQPDLVHFALFSLLIASVALLFIGFNILTGSLSFYLGNAEVLAEQLRFALISFSTYPASIFEGKIKLLLFTVIPAGFISVLPISALHSLSFRDALLAFGGAIAFLVIGVLVFNHGLTRYESGNLVQVRD